MTTLLLERIIDPDLMRFSWKFIIRFANWSAK